MSLATNSVECSVDQDISEIVQLMASANIGHEDSSSVQITQELRNLHCPFTWKPNNEDNCRNVLSTTEEKLSNVEDDGEEFSDWTKFVLNLILCYEYAKTGAVEYALEKQEECDIILDHAVANDTSGPVMGLGLKHVSIACKIFVLMKTKSFEEAKLNLRKVIDIKDMAERDQASVWSVRGALLLEYGLKGMKESVPFIEKALLLDSECGEWHFLLGKALSRIRRIEDRSVIPDKRELIALERAVSSSNNTFYMVLLAQSYVDTARQVSWQNRSKSNDIKSLCDSMNEKAADLYRKAMENCNENPYVLGRCAFGFMRLPPPNKDMECAKNCILRGLEKASNNGFLNHTAAVMYQKQNDLQKAKYYFSRSAENGNFRASMELLEIKLKENRSYNPVPDLERYLERFKEKPQQEHLLSLLGAYYYFVQVDFNTALNYWLKIMENDMDSTELKILNNPWPGSPRLCNVSKTIVNEVVRQLNENTCSEDERNTYQKVLNEYKKYHPGLVNSVEGVFAERSKYKQWCSTEQRSLPPASGVWHSMSRKSVGKLQKQPGTGHRQGENSWRRKYSDSEM